MINKEEKNVVDSSVNHFEISQDDKIDLYSLWKVVVKRKKVIIAIFMTSLIGATIYCLTAPKLYRVEAYIKIYMPKDMTPRDITMKDTTTVTNMPTVKELSTRLSGNIGEVNGAMFPNNADNIANVKIEELKVTTDVLKLTIESENREALATAPQQLVNYIENMPENKAIIKKAMAEYKKKIELLKKADNNSEYQIKEMEKKFNNTKVLPVNYDPVAINQSSINLKMEIFRLKHEIDNYKMVQLLQEPFVSKFPVKPNNRQIIVLAGIVGLMLGVFLVFIMEYFEEIRKNFK